MSIVSIFQHIEFWIVMAGLLLLGWVVTCILYNRRNRKLQKKLYENDRQQSILHQEIATFKERLEGKAQDIERSRSDFQIQIEDLIGERNSLRTQLNELRMAQGVLEKESASLHTQVGSIKTLTEERDQARAQTEQLRHSYAELDKQITAMSTQMGQERKVAEEKIELLKQTEQRMNKEFENLANRIFEEKQQKFNEVSKNSMEAVLNPVKDQLKDFRSKVEEVYDKEVRDRTSLYHEIKNLKALNERISQDAVNLTSALKGESKTRGDWGEVQLERILEQSGLKKGREYETQGNYENDQGRRFRPDIIVHLPEEKDVIIDSKVSLAAYDRYYSADTDDERQQHIKAHIASIRIHIQDLSRKNYDELVGVKSLDVVLMFIPIEGALLLALEHDISLQNEAYAKGILLISPTTLLGTLQIIHNIWRYEYQNLNAQKIALEAGRLHDQFVLFIEALEDIGKQLGKADDAYQIASKRLISGRGNLVIRSEKLKVMGAKTKKLISKGLVEKAKEQEGPELVAFTNPSVETENL